MCQISQQFVHDNDKHNQRQGYNTSRNAVGFRFTVRLERKCSLDNILSQNERK